jgi:starch synthase (maltosyl-transferring)
MDYLQQGGRPAFMARYVLAATLGSNCGVYGPAFELMENRPKEPGSEEYLNSEKYEIKRWDLEKPDSLKDFIAAMNRIRKDNPALQSDRRLRFHALDNPEMVCYSKRTADRSNVILTIVSLDWKYAQSGWVDLALEEIGVKPGAAYQVHDLLTGARYAWRGAHNYVELRPNAVPAHVLRVEPDATASPTPR